MSEQLTRLLLIALLAGGGFLLVVAAATWLGHRLFGYVPKGYEERFRRDFARVATVPAWTSEAELALARAQVCLTKLQIAPSGAMFDAADWSALAREADVVKGRIAQISQRALGEPVSSPDGGLLHFGPRIGIRSFDLRTELPPTLVVDRWFSRALKVSGMEPASRITPDPDELLQRLQLVGRELDLAAARLADRARST